MSSTDRDAGAIHGGGPGGEDANKRFCKGWPAEYGSSYTGWRFLHSKSGHVGSDSYQSIIMHQAEGRITCRWCSADVHSTIILVTITICVIHIADLQWSKSRLAAFTPLLISDSGVPVSFPLQEWCVYIYPRTVCTLPRMCCSHKLSPVPEPMR